MENINLLLSKFLKVLADPIRLKIIDFLANNPVSASKIQQKLNLSQSNTSLQLKKLVEMNIVDFKRNGKEKVFKIKDQGMLELISILKSYVINIEKKKFEEFMSLGKVKKLEGYSRDATNS